MLTICISLCHLSIPSWYPKNWGTLPSGLQLTICLWMRRRLRRWFCTRKGQKVLLLHHPCQASQGWNLWSSWESLSVTPWLLMSMCAELFLSLPSLSMLSVCYELMDWRELLYGMSHVRRLCQRCCMLPQFGGEASQQQLNNGFNPYCLSCKELAFCRSNSALLLNCANRQTEACFLKLSQILRTS